MRKIFTFLLVFMLLTAPCLAGSTNVKGAEKLKKALEQELLWQNRMIQLGGQGLSFDGTVTVEPQENTYKATVSGLSFIMAPDRRLEIGTAVIDAAPVKGGGWHSKVSLPATMALLDQKKTQLAELSIGQQRFAATWIPEKSIYPLIDGSYQDIRVKGLDEDKFTATVGTFRLITSLTENTDGTWSGPGGFEATSIAMDTAGKDAAESKIGALYVVTNYDSISPDKISAMRRKLMAAIEDGKPKTPEELRQLLPAQQQLVNGVTSTFSLKDLLFREKNVSEPRPPSEARLGSLAFRASVLGATKEQANANMTVSFSGLSLSSVPRVYQAFMPHSGNIEAKINPLPMGKISTLAFDAVQNGGGQAAAQTLTSLPQLLQTAGTALFVHNSFFRSSDLELDIDGQAKADSQALTGMTVQATISAKGLETVIQKLRDLSIAPDADPQLDTYAGGLTAVLLMGKNGKSEGISEYHFELTREGRFLMNNMNLATLMSAGAVLNERVKNPNPLIPVK